MEGEPTVSLVFSLGGAQGERSDDMCPFAKGWWQCSLPSELMLGTLMASSVGSHLFIDAGATM